MSKKPPPPFVDTQLNPRLKAVEAQMQSLGDLTKAINSFKTHPWKTTWPILVILGPVLSFLAYHAYALNNQVVSHVATESTKLDQLKATDDDATKAIIRQADKVDGLANKVEEVRVNDANQSGDLKQIRGTVEATQKDVGKLADSISGIRGDLAEIAKAVKERPVKASDASDPMQIKSYIETGFKTISRQYDAQMGRRTLSLELTRDDVDLKPPAGGGDELSFTVKTSYNKRDLAADLADLKPGAQTHLVFEERSPFDIVGLVGIATYGPPLKVEVRALTPTARERSQALIRALTDEGAAHVKFMIVLPTKLGN